VRFHRLSGDLERLFRSSTSSWRRSRRAPSGPTFCSLSPRRKGPTPRHRSASAARRWPMPRVTMPAWRGSSRAGPGTACCRQTWTGRWPTAGWPSSSPSGSTTPNCSWP
jgi:hypothetical protein